MVTSASPSAGTIHRYFEVSLFLLVTVGFLALASTGKLDIFSTLLAASALVVKALRYRGHSEPELSPRSVKLLTALYFFLYGVDFWLSGGWPDGFIRATTHLVLFIAVVKLFSARTNRDYLWLAVIAFMEILAAATLTVDTTFLVFFFLFLLVGISTFISYEIKRCTETARGASLAAGSRMGRRLERALLLTSLGVALSTLLLATVIFFLVPRFTTGYLSAYSLQPQQLSGFSDEVTLGDIGSIKRNPAVVMRVRAPKGSAYQLAGLRWRGIALTQFDGHRWYNPGRTVQVLPRSPPGRFLVGMKPFRDRAGLSKLPGQSVHYRVLLEPISTNTLFAAAVPLEIRGRFQLLGMDNTGSLLNLRHRYTRVAYEVVSNIGQPSPRLLRGLPADYSAEIRKRYLGLPRLDPRVEELARQLTARKDNPYDKARELERYLRTQFGYTLELPSTPEDDPIANFLFERRAGHCEYFAAAMTVMLRSQGIPVRLVNGFLTGEYNEVGENFIVRARDAHTWVEVFFPRVGWVAFDPTPPDPNALQRTWWTTVQHYADAFDLWWDEWIINYDQLHWERLGRNLRTAAVSAWELRRWFRQQRRALTTSINQAGERLLTSPYAVPAGLALFLTVILALRGRALAEWLRTLWLLQGGGGGALNASEATLIYQRLLRVLARRGYPKPPSLTPQEFAKALSPPELALPVGELTRLYNRARFGQQPAAIARLIEVLRAVENWKPRR
ncbi:MAG: DUF3488 and DUF4129 domain-containing transglutaminase family protein [Terriglobia bacterium]